MNWLKRNWLILLILVIALGLRLYRIDATMTFLEDEGRDLLIVKRMVDTGLPVLLGPQTSTGNMYLGPLYYYLITPALVLARMNPVGPAIFIALTGTLTTYLLYYLGKKWFSSVSGYLSALMFGLLPMSVMVTRASWNPHLVPLITVLMLLVFDKLLSPKPKWYHWLLYGVFLGTMVQLHYMALIFCGALSLVIAWHYKTSLTQLLRGVVLTVLGAVLILSPFILFEIRNDWVNSSAITRFLKAKEELNIRYDPPLWLWWDKVHTTTYRLVGNAFTGSTSTSLTNTLALSLFFALFLINLSLSFKAKHRYSLYLFAVLLISLATLGIYQENIHLHYLEFALPLLFLSVAGLYPHLRARPAKLSFMILGLGAISLGLFSTLSTINSGPTHQAQKAQAVAEYITSRAGDEPYNVVSTQDTYTTPFLYYLSLADNPPSNELAQRIFDICMGAPCPQDDETTTLLFLTGPGHPSIANYLGHPQLNSFSQPRVMLSNQHVALGIWVAEIMLE